MVGCRDPDRGIQSIDLARATLNGTTLTSADLARADLARADLIGAKLSSANLNSADLTDARWPEGELVPEGWRLDTGSGRLEQAGTGSRPAEAD